MNASTPDLASALRRRAAVLVDFELDWLGFDFAREAERRALPGFLSDDVQPVSRPGSAPRWRASDKAREAAARDGFAALRDAWREVGRRPEHPLQTAIDTLFGDDLAVDPWGRMSVDDLDRAELEAMAQVSRWFDGAGEPVPQYSAVEQLLRYELMLDPLREVATRFFRDREEERRILARPSGGQVKMIVGRGGIGKTALIAAHLLAAAQDGTLVVSLTFDHRAIDPAEPDTMVAEIRRQLLLQAASPAMRRRSAGHQSDRSSTATRDVRIFDDEVWAGEIRSLAREIGQPVIVVFDTIEEAQRRDWALTNLRKVMLLCASIDRWQVIGSGRAPVAGLTTTIELAGLPEDDAVALLDDLLGEQRTLSDAELRHVVSLVSTSPLCIRLAAGILRSASGELDSLSDLELRRGAIEGELYRRLLGHIEDPDVQKLAYPGLTLRRITPDLIRRVLAGPCQVSVRTQARAQELFEGLAREAMLVEQVEPGEIAHRTDIRPMMIERLAADEKDAVRRIHLAAIRYYRARDDAQSREEELYHRLMLAQTPRVVDPRMTDEAAARLAEVADEFPPKARRYLKRFAPRVELSDADLRQLDDDDRRPTVEKQARQLVSGGQITQALALLESMPARDGSPLLPLLELQVRELVGDFDHALALGRAEEQRRAAKGDTAGAVEAALHCARLQERLGRTGAAAQDLAALAETVSLSHPRGDDLLTALRLVVARLRLRRFGARVEDRADLVAEALELFPRIPASTLRREPALLRDLAGELGTDVPTSILTAALDAGEVSDEDGTLLPALSAFDAKVSQARGKQDGVLTERLRVDAESSVDSALEDLMAPAAPPSATADFISNAIKEYGLEAPDELSDSLTRNFRGASDRATEFRIEEP